MAEARVKHDWRQTANILALIANGHRDPKKKPTPWEPWDFCPLLQEEQPEPLPGTIHDLKVFLPPDDPARRTTP
jgi:hypothetical protein